MRVGLDPGVDEAHHGPVEEGRGTQEGTLDRAPALVRASGTHVAICRAVRCEPVSLSRLWRRQEGLGRGTCQGCCCCRRCQEVKSIFLYLNNSDYIIYKYNIYSSSITREVKLLLDLVESLVEAHRFIEPDGNVVALDVVFDILGTLLALLKVLREV